VHAIRMDIVTVAALILPVATVTAVTESLVTNVAAAAKRSVPVIHVATVTAATESLVTHVAAAVKRSVNAKLLTN
jgi:predicted HAD superfamily phosphohydrolase YqeG